MDREEILFGELITEDWFYYEEKPIDFLKPHKTGKIYGLIKNLLQKHININAVELKIGLNQIPISINIQFSIILYTDAVCFQVLSENANPYPAWVRVGDRMKKLEFEIYQLIQYALSLTNRKKIPEILF